MADSNNDNNIFWRNVSLQCRQQSNTVFSALHALDDNDMIITTNLNRTNPCWLVQGLFLALWCKKQWTSGTWTEVSVVDTHVVVTDLYESHRWLGVQSSVRTRCPDHTWFSGLAAEVGRLDKVMCTWSLFKLPTIKLILVGGRHRRGLPSAWLTSGAVSVWESAASALIFVLFFSSAFNTIHSSLLAPILKAFMMTDWTCNYLCGRPQYVQLNDAPFSNNVNYILNDQWVC